MGSQGSSTPRSRQPSRTSRGRGIRTTTGCMTCRKRHVKCDESKPDCQQCIRGKRSCDYSNLARDSTPKRNSNSSNNVRTSADLQQDAFDGVANDMTQNLTLALDQTSTQVADQRTPTEAQFAAYQPGPSNSLPSYAGLSPVSPATTSGYHSVGVATARWFGLLADDAEIDLGPTSDFDSPNIEHDRSAMFDMSLPLNYYEPGSRQQYGIDNSLVGNIDPKVVAGGDQPDLISEKALWQSTFPLVLKSNEQSMFDKFVIHISQWMDLFDPCKSFSSLVPRLALYNVGLLKAILSLSIRHGSLNAKPMDQPSFTREDALQYYHETLQYVRKAMQYKSYHTSLELHATTLIISAYEMLDGSSREWERHLQGVFWIQRSQVIHGDSGGLRAAAWWAWLCQDIWAAFKDKREVFTFWKPERTFVELNALELASRSVFIMGRVINYCVAHGLTNAVDSITVKLSKAEALTGMLDEWHSYLTPEFSPLPHPDKILSDVFQSLWIYPPVFGVSLQVYHAARILVLLHKPALGGIGEALKRQSVLDKHVNVICGIALKLSDYASSTMSAQCLFIAGLCTHDQKRRREIVRLIQTCRERTGWPVTPLEDDLEKCWNDDGG